ncbi:MAG: SDR family oxidoreductase [Rhodospirillales bacterium]|nr:SDR family oxidoreductase [Rhodospirillales bacterium]
MDLGIAGRNALVTGGSLGIGRAVALELAANGVNVAISARNPDRLADVARELTSNTGGRVVAVPGDMSKPEDIARVMAETGAALGDIDILVNNAGSSPAGRLQDLDDETWYAAFELKFMGYMRCARAVAPDMRARKWGRIVNIIGAGGPNPSAGYILGGSFNAALLNFTRALAKDCAPDNVLVNGVNPGATDTPRWKSLVEQNARISGKSEAEISAQSVANVPLGRPAQPDEIADVTAFLCSERASHMAGALLNVDGGASGGL